jgi:hypothetical protein
MAVSRSVEMSCGGERTNSSWGIRNNERNGKHNDTKLEPTKEGNMRVIGMLLLLVGLGMAFITWNKDTTVSTELGRVHNIGLMADRRDKLFLSGAAAVTGAILLGFGEVLYKKK